MLLHLFRVVLIMALLSIEAMDFHQHFVFSRASGEFKTLLDRLIVLDSPPKTLHELGWLFKLGLELFCYDHLASSVKYCSVGGWILAVSRRVISCTN